MQNNLNAFELVELRLVQQGRAQYSDGRDWIRMAVGVLLTTAAFLTGVLFFEWSKAATSAMLIAGVIITVGWVMKAGEVAKATRMAELELRSTDVVQGS